MPRFLFHTWLHMVPYLTWRDWAALACTCRQWRRWVQKVDQATPGQYPVPSDVLRITRWTSWSPVLMPRVQRAGRLHLEKRLPGPCHARAVWLHDVGAPGLFATIFSRARTVVVTGSLSATQWPAALPAGVEVYVGPANPRTDWGLYPRLHTAELKVGNRHPFTFHPALAAGLRHLRWCGLVPWPVRSFAVLARLESLVLWTGASGRAPVVPFGLPVLNRVCLTWPYMAAWEAVLALCPMLRTVTLRSDWLPWRRPKGRGMRALTQVTRVELMMTEDRMWTDIDQVLVRMPGLQEVVVCARYDGDNVEYCTQLAEAVHEQRPEIRVSHAYTNWVDLEDPRRTFDD